MYISIVDMSKLFFSTFFGIFLVNGQQTITDAKIDIKYGV